MNNFTIQQSGTLLYDPDRGQMKNNTENWCVLQLPNDLVKYYQYFLKKELHIDLCMPAWGAHISIIRGERILPQYMNRWKEHNGKKFTVMYDPEIISIPDKKQDGHFYYVEVQSPELMQIRADLGLSTHRTFHITIGRTYYN